MMTDPRKDHKLQKHFNYVQQFPKSTITRASIFQSIEQFIHRANMLSAVAEQKILVISSSKNVPIR